MFKSAVIKLTLMYLAILIVISAFFSINLYRTSVREVERGLRPPPAIEKRANIRKLLEDPAFDDERTELIAAARHRIAMQLIYVNAGILLLGGVGSYLLAKRTLKPIERAHKAQNRFSADASHELRTPLATMQTEIEVALRDEKLDLVRSKKLLESNLEEVGRLTSLTEGLLRLAGDSDNSGHRERVALAAVLASAVESHQKQAKAKKITLSVDIAPDVFVSADPAQLERIFSTLIDNAVRYGKTGDRVLISGTVHGRSVVVRVRDEGPGIAPEDLPHIFDRFYRTDTSRTKGIKSGYGLGLAIARQITEAHGGSINVTSVIGKGTTFTVALPTAKQ